MLYEVIDMKRFLILLMTLCLLPVAAMAEEEPYRLAATVTAEQSALLSLPIGGAAEVLPLVQGDALTITALGTSYCEAVSGDVSGYVATADVAFDVMNGETTKLGVLEVSTSNQYWGRVSLWSKPSNKSKALKRIERGAIVLIAGEADGMWHVYLPDMDGYLVKKYVKDVKPVESYRIAYVEPGVNAWLRLDSQYAQKYMICKLAPGTPVQFIKNPNGWAQVEVAGYRGRMLANNLTFEAPEAE